MGIPSDGWLKLSSRYKRGARDLITDVPGILVGHRTVDDPSRDIHTGVTAIVPADGDVFREKIPAGVAVINGFGKSAGLLQVEELGTIETPIMLTNTFGVGTGINALTKYMLERHPEIGVSVGTVNCVVTECNDGKLNDIRGMHLTEDDFIQALDSADITFDEGAVGGGRGMVCMGLKGGIGSASRIVDVGQQGFTVGTLVMTNFGSAGRLRINGEKTSDGKPFYEIMKGLRSSSPYEKDSGSCILTIGTDLPLDSRQLTRIAKRGAAALGKTGSFIGTGSGDIAIAFSNGNRIPYDEKGLFSMRTVGESAMDEIFEATVECLEEAIISSLYHGESMTGIRGNRVRSLAELAAEGR